MKIINSKGIIDRRFTPYPCFIQLCEAETIKTEQYCSIYGYVLEGTVEFKGKTVYNNHYFNCTTTESIDIKISGKAALITRLGFIGQESIGGPIEDKGRLCYIDGCSDSLLIYPPRMGDPSLNILYFPTNINQTFHIHPSVRMGMVIKGEGICATNDGEQSLKLGDIFCIDIMERHRFCTVDSEMTVIAFHPDGDWGPTDHSHSMINRTYI
jgi:mannose-6-phosphate isomerase-like protein (cupin superfamily)